MPERVIWHRRAEDDLTAAYLYLGTDSPAAAEQLLDAVDAAIQLLFETPHAGRLLELRSHHARGMRSLALKGFRAYLLFYRPAGNDLVIVRLLHGARDLPRLLEGGA